MKPLRLLVVAVLSAFAAGNCGRTDASTPVADSQAADADANADAEAELQPPDLSQHTFPLLVWSAFEVERDYFDKQRIDPRGQLVAATAALGLHTPEFFAEASGDSLQVRVRSARAEFALGDVTTLLGAATRLEEVLVYADSVLDLEPEQQHELEYAAINGLFGPLDPHTVLLTPEQHADLGVRTKGEFGGVGAQIRTEARRIVIVSVMPDMPAALAGVLPNDVVLTIDGESTVNMSAEEAQLKLRGPVGSPVILRLQRARKQLTVKVTRDTIRIESVRAVRLPDDVAYLAVAAFQETTAAEARTALAKLGAGVRGLVLDLRGNSGGVLTQATEMIDDFVSKGELVVVRSAEGDEIAEANAEVVLDQSAPVVVLIDENAASAAEIVGGGLQALSRAVVLGRTSFGKGTVQMVRAAAPYGQELALKLTLAEWLVAGGRHIQSAGVVPDLVLQPVEPSNVPGVVRFYDEERFERSRERSRAAHLPSAKYDIGKDMGQAAEAAALHLRYLAAADEAPAGAPAELADPELRIAFEVARDLAKIADPNTRRTELGAVAARIRVQEDARITRALAADKIEWTPAPAGASPPPLVASARVTGPRTIAAGEPFGLELTIVNTGSVAAHRVHAITDCVHDELDGIELMIGQIPAGATVTRELKLHVMPWHADFTDALDVDVHVGEPDDSPDAEARVMFEIAGANRPALAYEYWIVDDPTLAAAAPARPEPEEGGERSPLAVTGNGDGVLQPGERVLLAFVAHNLGAGNSPDARVLLRNLSGRQGLLEEGFYALGELAPEGAKGGAFGLTVSDEADPAIPLELELVLGDAKLRTSAQDRLRFRVLPQGAALVPGAKRVEVGSERARLYLGAHPSTAVAAYAEPGSVLQTSGDVGGYHAVDGGGQGRRIFLPADLEGLHDASGGRAAAPPARRIQVLPPTVELESYPRVTKAAAIELRGRVEHRERARDVVVLVRPPGTAQVDRKVYFGANDANDGEAARKLAFTAAVPLEPGGNRITVLARDGAKVVHRHDVWVYREP